MFAVRAAVRSDEESLAAMWKEFLGYLRSIEPLRPTHWERPAEDVMRPLLVAAWDQAESHAAFIAESECRAIGFSYVQLRETGPSPAHINALFVREEARGCGIGETLLDAAVAWCRPRGVPDVSLDCLCANALALSFYERRGWRPLLSTFVLAPMAAEAASALIRPATAGDIPEIARIVERAYRHYIPRMGRPPGPMLDDYALRVSEGVVSVIGDAGGLAGVLVLLPKPDHLLLDNVAVLPERQGSGFGRRLLEFAEAEGVRRGYREIRLYTHETMVENLRLYAAIGYEETGRGIEAGYERVFMRKPLAVAGAAGQNAEQPGEARSEERR